MKKEIDQFVLKMLKIRKNEDVWQPGYKKTLWNFYVWGKYQPVFIKLRIERSRVFLFLTNKCIYDLNYAGLCLKRGFPYCPTHVCKKCSVCGGRASLACETEIRSLLCGNPLCKKHENKCKH